MMLLYVQHHAKRFLVHEYSCGKGRGDLLEVLVHLEPAAMAGPRTHRLNAGHGHIELVLGDERGRRWLRKKTTGPGGQRHSD
jgi:hypothetical protein